MVERESDPNVTLVEIRLCELCLGGVGGECHSPGCALFLRRAPDLRLDPDTDYAVVPAGTVRVSEGAIRMVLKWLGYPASNPGLCRGALDEFGKAVRHG